MLRALVLVLSLSAAATAQAAANCVAHPPAERMSLDTLREKLLGQGYQIKILKVDGNCYELYGRDSQGRKVEIYFDTATGAPVKSRIRN